MYFYFLKSLKKFPPNRLYSFIYLSAVCNNKILIALYLYQHLIISVLLLLTMLVDKCLIVVLICVSSWLGWFFMCLLYVFWSWNSYSLEENWDGFQSKITMSKSVSSLAVFTKVVKGCFSSFVACWCPPWTLHHMFRSIDFQAGKQSCGI